MEDSVSSKTRRGSRTIRAISKNLEETVSHIAELDSAAVHRRWKAVFRAAPPANLSRGFLVRALAYRTQEGVLGGLRPSASRILDRVAEDHSSPEPKRAPTRRAAPGTVLIRQWRGVTHRVTVLDNDVVYRGRRYKSLSEVARLITGTRWSGPMFFGLRNRKKEMVNG